MNYPQMQNPYHFIPQNPYMTPSSQEMVQRFNGYQPPMQPVQQTQQAQPYPCMPVTSVDEVKAMQVDFSGKPTFYYNAASNEVYIKQLNGMGASEVKTYMLAAPDGQNQPETGIPATEPSPNKYVTQGEFETLQSKVNELIGGLQDVKSTANDEQPNVAASPANGAGEKSKRGKSDNQ